MIATFLESYNFAGKTIIPFVPAAVTPLITAYTSLAKFVLMRTLPKV